MINSQEALKILEGLGVLARAEAAYDMAVEALKKQIPMKTGILEIGINKKRIIPCGSCGEALASTLWSFCPWCGQARLE